MGAGVRRRGATKVEYALLLSLISVGCLPIAATLGGNVSGLFNDVIPAGEARPAADAPGAGAGAADPGQPAAPGAGGGKKAKKARPNRGQPGSGNPGDDKAVGKSAAPAGSQ